MLFHSDKRPRNALTAIFAEPEHADILLGIFNNLAIQHIPALLRVSPLAHLNSVYKPDAK